MQHVEDLDLPNGRKGLQVREVHEAGVGIHTSHTRRPDNIATTVGTKHSLSLFVREGTHRKPSLGVRGRNEPLARRVGQSAPGGLLGRLEVLPGVGVVALPPLVLTVPLFVVQLLLDLAHRDQGHVVTEGDAEKRVYEARTHTVVRVRLVVQVLRVQQVLDPFLVLHDRLETGLPQAQLELVL